MNTKIFNKFSKWLNKILDNNSFDKVVAFNFNLYEGSNEYYIELIGSDEFDERDQDWACSEVFTTREDIFKIATKDINMAVTKNELAAILMPDTELFYGEEWFATLDFCIKIITEYLGNGKSKDKLLEKKAVGIGFADGDLYILYHNVNMMRVDGAT